MYSNTKHEDNYVYKLNWELFCKEYFNLIKVPYNTVEFSIISDHNCNSTLYYKTVLYDQPTKHALVSTNTSSLIKCFDGKQFKINQGYNSKQLCFFDDRTNGFFIDKIWLKKLV